MVLLLSYFHWKYMVGQITNLIVLSPFLISYTQRLIYYQLF